MSDLIDSMDTMANNRVDWSLPGARPSGAYHLPPTPRSF